MMGFETLDADMGSRAGTKWPNNHDSVAENARWLHNYEYRILESPVRL